MRVFFLLCFIYALMIAAMAGAASALGVTPLVIELRSGTANRSAQIVVNNDGAVDMPIELEIYRVELEENGQQHRSPAKSDFVVFPPMRLIPPHGKQVFKIQWAGAPLTKSQVYVFLVSQPPVQMPGAQSGVQVDFKFEVVVNVAPPSGTHTLELVASSVTTVDGKRYASLLLSNSGNVHALLSDATLTLRSGSWSRTVLPGDLQRILGLGIVQPGKRRRITIPVELPRDVSNVAAEVSYNAAFH
jgi:fimbrial chaperone protein